MADKVEETTNEVEHTHDDGTTHSHEDGDKEHTHDDAPAPPAFNLGDLAAVKQIIEVSSRRGAFNAAELTAVGGTYDRLMAFLQFHVPPAEEASTPEEAEIETKDVPSATGAEEHEPEIDRD